MGKRGRKLFDRDLILIKLAEIGETTIENLLNVSYNFLLTTLNPPKNIREALAPFDQPVKLNLKEQMAWQVMISRMRREGIIKNKNKKIVISKEGNKRIRRRFWKPLYRAGRELEDGEMILFIFDIPEFLRGWRDWLRFQLSNLSFSPLQKSVWIGKNAIPKEFIEDLKKHKLMPHIHIFSVNKKGTLT